MFKKTTLSLFFLLHVYDWCVHVYMHKYVLGGQRAMSGCLLPSFPSWFERVSSLNLDLMSG